MGGTEGERDLVASDMVEIMKKKKESSKKGKTKRQNNFKT